MSAVWVGVVALSAIGLGMGIASSLSSPARVSVQANVSGFRTVAPYNKAMTDKAMLFASTASTVGVFSGALAWPALALVAGLPSSISGSAAMPGTWRATNNGVPVVCVPGLPRAAVSAVAARFTSVTVTTNNAC